MKISFLVPSFTHPNSKNKSVADIALELESRFHIYQRFMKDTEPKLYERLITLLFRQLKDKGVIDKEQIYFLASEFLRNEYRRYMINQEHGLTTKAARKDNRKSFIDTTTYTQSLRIECHD